jgi:hypothetical protein
MQPTTTPVPAATTYYVTKEKNLFVLRQTRYAKQLAAGKEHPHDVCAYATKLAEMQDMVTNTLKGTADYSQVQ